MSSLTTTTNTSQGSGNVVYTFELLSNYFESSLNDAAVMLHISTTRLKSICRGINIKRWPYRRIVSLKQRQQQLEMQLEQMKKHSAQSQTLNMLRLDIEQVKRDIMDVKTNPKNSFIVGTSKQSKSKKKEEEEENEEEEEVVTQIEDRNQNTMDLKKSFYKLDQQMKRNLAQGQPTSQQNSSKFSRAVDEEQENSKLILNRNALLRTQSMMPTLDTMSASNSHGSASSSVENRLQSNHTLLRQRHIPTLQIFEQRLPSIHELMTIPPSNEENSLWRQNSFVPFHISPSNSPRKVEDDYEDDEEEQVVPYQNHLLPMQQQQPSSANMRRSPTLIRRTRSLSPSRRNVTKNEVVHFSPYHSPRSNSASPRTDNTTNQTTLPPVYSVTHNNHHPLVGHGVPSGGSGNYHADLSPTVQTGIRFLSIEQQEQQQLQQQQQQYLHQQDQQMQQQHSPRSAGGNNSHKLDINFILNK